MQRKNSRPTTDYRLREELDVSGQPRDHEASFRPAQTSKSFVSRCKRQTLKEDGVKIEAFAMSIWDE